MREFVYCLCSAPVIEPLIICEVHTFSRATDQFVQCSRRYLQPLIHVRIYHHLGLDLGVRASDWVTPNWLHKREKEREWERDGESENEREAYVWVCVGSLEGCVFTNSKIFGIFIYALQLTFFCILFEKMIKILFLLIHYKHVIAITSDERHWL